MCGVFYSDPKVVNVFVIESLCHIGVRLMVSRPNEASSTINQCIFVGVRALHKLGTGVRRGSRDCILSDAINTCASLQVQYIVGCRSTGSTVLLLRSTEYSIPK